MRGLGLLLSRFHEAGVELPRCHGYEDFWDRFTLAPAATVWYADSNAWAAHVFPSDIGGQGCWTSVHLARPTEEPVIPVSMSIDSGEAPTVTFEAVFVCRSRAWVPSWCDHQFTEFLEACPARLVEHPENVWRHPRDDVERMERLSTRTGQFKHR
ncbi:hypothetical protein GCM10010245_68720 [Streptomyces spectabilis]|nr:hypothetical protein GCM10010245_68720 [Streptomyces spectabilis]